MYRRNSHKYVDPIELHGIRGFITVKDVLNAINKVYAHQENSILNAGNEGKIYGQVNSIFVDHRSDGTYCVMTLAPYKNGSRVMNCQVEGIANPPLHFNDIIAKLQKIDENKVVMIRITDPLATGPNIGRVIEYPVNQIDIDKIYGIFMRLRNDIKPIIISQGKGLDFISKINEETLKIVKRLPEAVEYVINLHASMTFDYAPDFDEDVKKDIRRAKQLGIEFSYNDSSIYDAGYVSGTVGQILKFIHMSPHLLIANRKYSSGIEYEAGVTLNIDKHDLRKITSAQFTEFVNWMGASFPDFIDGIKENDQLSKLYKSI